MAALTHVLGLFTWIVGPLVILLVSGDEFVKENARNALNWQIFMTIYTLVGLVLLIVAIGALILFVIGFLDLIFCIVAAVKASEGEAWTYPLTIDLV